MIPAKQGRGLSLITSNAYQLQNHTACKKPIATMELKNGLLGLKRNLFNPLEVKKKKMHRKKCLKI